MGQELRLERYGRDFCFGFEPLRSRLKGFLVEDLGQYWDDSALGFWGSRGASSGECRGLYTIQKVQFILARHCDPCVIVRPILGEFLKYVGVNFAVSFSSHLSGDV